MTYPLGTGYLDRMDVASPNPYTPERLPVIGEVERSAVGNTIIRAGLAHAAPHRGWEQTLHLVLSPEERERLIADLIAQR